MSMEATEGYWVPECVRAYLRGAGYSTRALEDMEPHVREWDRWMRAVGEFYDYRDTDGFERVYQAHRRTIMPAVPGVAEEVGTGSTVPAFCIVRPAVPNTRVDFSPYGQSVFADAVDVAQSVDLAYDALINEVDAGKMRVFLSDVMFDQERTKDGRRVPIPFGKGDCTVFRKVMSTEDTIQEFAPALRTEAQGRAFRLALQVLGDLVGLGANYFDLDNVGYVKTATEVSSDNSALMRNVRKNENALEGALAGVSRAVMACSR